MKKVLITGATGMIGNLVLQHCLENDAIREVVSIVRKSSGCNHLKLKEIIHSDFLDYSSIANEFESIDIAYFCIGVYTGAVKDIQFRTITVDYTKVFADMLKAKSPKVTFCFLSGQGADTSERSTISFAKYKGMAENYLTKQNFGNLFIFRPGYIYPVEKRKEPNLSYNIFRFLYPFLKNILGKNASITSTDLSKAIFFAGLNFPNQSVLENRNILEYSR